MARAPARSLAVPGADALKARRPFQRLALLAVLAAGLAPGLWWRPDLPPPHTGNELAVIPLGETPRRAGELELTGAWQLDSPNEHFHGYSALAILRDGRFLAASDRGRMLLFAPPGAPPRPPVFDHFAGEDAAAKRFADIEALAHDPETGRIWAAYEVANMIRRFTATFAPDGKAAPAAMRDWSEVSGPESMVRLADGRFIVLAEGGGALFASGSPGLLFPADPVDGAEPVPFRLRAPEGYRPVDIAQLPGGRVMILLRAFAWGLPPRFTGKLMLADPAAIRENGEWSGRVIADLAPPLPSENYEGLAIEPGEDGGAILWLISDDNEMRFQRTLLLRFVWRAKE